ncbi:FAD-dependent oxidoreductase [Sulfurimonas sp. HSL3-7]|uniref:NAD(P)/FAD-dependent oxidoreductase n=1 Tax=Sulfonitrofixus jiaomeiensis TaxID=3131938 RepID=UPI0031F99F55
MQIYDTAVIGAGINGCSCAYFLKEAGQKVVLIDREGIASGGSGAAGAFISPKFTKGGPLKELLEEAYRFSLDFYTQNFPGQIQRARLLQIANSDENALRLNAFKETTTLPFSEDISDVEPLLTPYAKACASIVLEEGGVVDAQAMCKALAAGIDLKNEQVGTLAYSDGIWQAGSVKAKRVILATGSYDFVVEMPYLKLRRVWGHRIDVKTSTKVPFSIHHHLSVSPSSDDGTVAIGATHDLRFDPFGDESYDYEAGREELLQKALKSVRLEDVEVLRDYTGLRSGSNDYLPIAGRVVDASGSLARGLDLINIKKIGDEQFVYYPELYMINGSGGYGFVFAPYLAKQLSDHICKGQALDPELSPSRFFKRWAKKRAQA